MTERGAAREKPDPQRLNDFIAECILALEHGGEAAMEVVLAKQPELADRARSRIKGLQASGLLGEPEADPERIGPYRVRERLGSGGMGTVYLAEQDGDLERRVAIKVVKRGMDSREVLARFALERQALAMLDHQNIAKVLDAGQTGDGRPFLVMEYVSGLPITRYCDERRLSVADRIGLFCLVCEAVQHAHHKGLIHRDLKPSNILVADREGRPWPIVIDFGVAKSLGSGLSASSVVTVRGRVLGTPEYMSPEQASNEMDVDTRTDVFSLGVVLYELLTGTLPIDSSTLRRADSGELSRILRSFDTPAPSRRITKLGTADGGAASSRRTDLPQLQKRLRGDLDWITLRALERDRNRRYGMPGELAADLQRHLRDEPVLAGPPGAFYRWSKFYARNRLQVVSAAIVLLTLVAGLWSSFTAYRAADESARQSDADFDNALGAIERLVFFGDEGLVDEPQMDEVRRHLLQDALRFYQQVAAGRSEEPRLRMRVAQAAARAGRIQYQLGEYEAALATVEQAKRAFAVVDPRDVAVGTMAFLDSLRGQILLALGRPTDGEQALRAAHAEFATAVADPGATPQVRRSRVAVAGMLARTLQQRDAAAARTEYEAAMVLAEPYLSTAVEDPAGRAMALAVAVQHAALLVDLGDAASARPRLDLVWQQITDEWERRAAPDRRELVDCTQELSAVWSRLGELGRAEELMVLLTEQQRWMCGAYPAQTSGPRTLGAVLHNLADVQLRQGRHDEALATVRESVQVLGQLYARSPGNAARSILGQAVLSEARLLEHPRTMGGEVDADAVEAVLQRGIELLDGLPADLRRQRQVRVPLALAWSLRARNHQAAGRIDAAVAAAERAVADLESMLATNPQSVDVRRRLANMRGELASILLVAREWARVLVLADAIDADAAIVAAASPTSAAESPSLRTPRLRMCARAGLGDVDGVLALVREPELHERDWNGTRQKAEAVLSLVENLPTDDTRCAALLGEARTLLQKALGFGDAMGMSAMVAVMSAQTLEVLVRVEQVAGDLRAAAAAAEAAVVGYEPSLRQKDSMRNRERTFRAGGMWMQSLLDLRDPVSLANAIRRLGATFERHGPETLRLAEWAAKLTRMDGQDAAAAAVAAGEGVVLLRRALALGACDLATIERSEPLAPLRAHPDFAALRGKAK